MVASTPVATNAICTLCHLLGTTPESLLVSKLALGVGGGGTGSKPFRNVLRIHYSLWEQ